MKKVLAFHHREMLPYFNEILKSHFKLKNDIDKNNYNCSEADLAWLEQIFIISPNDDVLLEIITDNFSHIELYHTCSPKKLIPYYESGIQLLEATRIEEEFKELVQSQISGYKCQDITNAIDKSRNFYANTRQISSGNNICFHFDKRHALQQPSFSFYGGEYMCYIIRHYSDKKIEKQLIKHCKALGIPTLLTIRLPLDKEIRNKDGLMSYIRTILVQWASRYIYKQHLKEEVNYICSTTYNLNYNVDSKFICRHEHPRQFCINRSEFYCDKCKKKIIRN